MQVTCATPRSWPGSLLRRVLLAVVVGLVLGACTGDEPPEEDPPAPAPEPEEVPSTPLGASVAVVVPSDEQIDPPVQEQLEREVELLGEWVDEGIREVRPYVADEPAFVGDLVELLAERHTDLVCVLGPDAAGVVEPLVARYGGVRFCTVEVADLPGAVDPDGPNGQDGADGGDEDDGDDRDDGDDGEPAAVTRIQLRVEELGYAVGIGAAQVADGATVGLVLGADELPRSRFRVGLLAALDGGDVVEPDVDPGASLEERAADVVASGAEVVVLDGGAGASAAMEALPDDVAVLGPTAVVDAAEDTGGVVSWRVRWDLVLRRPVRELLGDQPSPRALGLADGVFSIDLDDAAADVADAVTRAVEAISEGEQDPLSAAPGRIAPPPGPGADAPGGDADDPDTPPPGSGSDGAAQEPANG